MPLLDFEVRRAAAGPTARRCCQGVQHVLIHHRATGAGPAQLEKKILHDSLEQACAEGKKRIEIREEVATTDALRTAVTLGCRALHFSGHGHREFLAFENGRGSTHAVTGSVRGGPAPRQSRPCLRCEALTGARADAARPVRRGRH